MRLSKLIPTFPKECQFQQRIMMMIVELSMNFATKSFEWKTPVIQAFQKWHPDRRPERQAEIYPPLPEIKEELSGPRLSEPPPAKERSPFTEFRRPKPHVERIPENFLFTLEEFEKGEVPDQKEINHWTQPLKWTEEEDDATDDELREGAPYQWGEHYGGSATRKKLQDEIECKSPQLRKLPETISIHRRA
jgi:hypothetical protein